MSRFHRLCASSASLCLCGLAVLSSLETNARAVIEVKMPIEKMVETTKLIVLGKITAIDPAGQTLTLDITETLRGETTLAKLTAAISDPADLAPQLHVGSPIILMYSQDKVGGKPNPFMLVHTADRWLTGRSSAANPDAISITGTKSDASRDTFPGKTPALARILREAKTGKTSLLDKLGDRLLNSDQRQLAKLPNIKNPTSFSAADINNDGKPDLLICSENKLHLFIASDKEGGGYEDQTEKYGLQNIAGDFARFLPPVSLATAPATQEAPPSPGIFIAGTIYRLMDGQFARTFSNVVDDFVAQKPPANSKILAAAQGRFGDDDDETFVMAVTPSNLLRINLKEYAESTYKDSSTDNDTRLTGSPLAEYHPDQKTNGFKNPQLVPLDANGDGRPDLLLIADGGGAGGGATAAPGANLLLLNRGFGAFLVDPDAAKSLTHTGGALYAAAPLHPNSKKDSLLILTPDGTLFAIDTTSPPATDTAPATQK